MPELVHKARRIVCCESCEKSCDVQLLLEWERGWAAEAMGPALVTQPEAGLICVCLHPWHPREQGWIYSCVEGCVELHLAWCGHKGIKGC